MMDSYENAVFCPDYLAEARALIRVFDDKIGRWVPVNEGGLTNVFLQKGTARDSSGQLKTVYFIFGLRISDGSVILSYLIKKSFQYNRAAPLFRLWELGDERLRLTFHTLAEAIAFGKGVQLAVSDICGSGDEPCLTFEYTTMLDDDDETFEVPLTGVDSHSASDSTSRDSSQTTLQEQVGNLPHLLNNTSESPTQSERHDYLELSDSHEHINPDAEGTVLVQPHSSGSVQGIVMEAAPENAAKPSEKAKKTSGRARCRYCHEIYLEEDNKRGSCEYAPDRVRTAVEEVTCVRAARCMMYHCMSDEEGDFAEHPCECTSEDDNRSRWMGLAFLSIFVPCLCLYPPLRSCHWLCLRVGLCGGRHRSAF